MITLAKGITICGILPRSHLTFQEVLVLTEILHISLIIQLLQLLLLDGSCLLDLAGINTNTFKAYSVRDVPAAATSAGLATEQIINANKEVLYQVLLRFLLIHILSDAVLCLL